MGSLEVIGGAVGGAFSGAVTAWFTARGRVEAVRTQMKGELEKIERLRDFEVKDREDAARDAAAAMKRATAEELRRAAADLVHALQAPDALQRNVNSATQAVIVATAKFEGSDIFAQVANDLLAASQAKDVDAAKRALAQLRNITEV